MRIVKRVFLGSLISKIPSSGKAFEHEQKNLVSIDPIVFNDYIYWVCTYNYPDASIDA